MADTNVDDDHELVENPDNPKEVVLKSTNRRRMAWLAMISMIGVTILLIGPVSVEKVTALETVVTWFYMAMSTIVCGYMGATTYAYVAGKKS